jgi:hypothetical protein
MTARNVSVKKPAHSPLCIGTFSFVIKIASYETPALPAKSVQPNNLLIEMTCKPLQCLSFLASNAASSSPLKQRWIDIELPFQRIRVLTSPEPGKLSFFVIIPVAIAATPLSGFTFRAKVGLSALDSKSRERISTVFTNQHFVDFTSWPLRVLLPRRGSI